MVNLLSYIFPQTLAQYPSDFNNEILVKEFFGKKYLEVGGLVQSGWAVDSLWKKALNKFKVQKKPIQNILILGLGGGTVAYLLQQILPQAKMTGIEKDPLIVTAGKKFLKLTRVKNLHIYIEDAFKFCQKQAKNQQFDLIIVDLFCGYNYPLAGETPQFFKNLQYLLTKNGVVIFNRLYFQKYIFEANQFLDKLAQIFQDVDRVKIRSNLFIQVH